MIGYFWYRRNNSPEREKLLLDYWGNDRFPNAEEYIEYIKKLFYSRITKNEGNKKSGPLLACQARTTFFAEHSGYRSRYERY